jgi:hypothetical protein
LGRSSRPLWAFLLRVKTVWRKADAAAILEEIIHAGQVLNEMTHEMLPGPTHAAMVLWE